MGIKSYLSRLVPCFLCLFVGALLAPVSISAQTVDTLWIQNFEGGWGSWYTSGGVWEVGVPTYGTSTPPSGVNCAGTVLGGIYASYANARLISPPFVVPAASENPRLRFYHWFSTENTDDRCHVQISADLGVTWTTIWDPWEGGGNGWSRGAVDLTDYAEQTIMVGFRFTSDGNYNGFAGWYIDDVVVETGPYEDLMSLKDFESGFGDWWVQGAVWEVGAPATGPGSGYASNNCAGTRLVGNYVDHVYTRLVSPAFEVPTASENPRLRFYNWYSTENTDDRCYIQVSTDLGVNWTTIWGGWDGGWEGGGNGWSRGAVDLTDYAEQTIMVGFRFTSDGDYNGFAGWYIDDVVVETGPYEDLMSMKDFESGFGDWWVQGALWEVGAPATGPGSGYASDNCAGTRLDGSYGGYSKARLISPPFVVPAAFDNPRLRFFHWFATELKDDKCRVQISDDQGLSWVTVDSVTGTGSVWTPMQISLVPYAQNSIMIGFLFTSDDNYNDGAGWYIDDLAILFDPTAVIDVGSPALPDQFALSQNHPNPFNPSTTIEFSLPARSHVEVHVFNILGKRVKTLHEGELAAGTYAVTWDGRNESNRPVATGIYLYRIKTDDFVESKKMVLLK